MSVYRTGQSSVVALARPPVRVTVLDRLRVALARSSLEFLRVAAYGWIYRSASPGTVELLVADLVDARTSRSHPAFEALGWALHPAVPIFDEAQAANAYRRWSDLVVDRLDAANRAACADAARAHLPRTFRGRAAMAAVFVLGHTGECADASTLLERRRSRDHGTEAVALLRAVARLADDATLRRLIHMMESDQLTDRESDVLIAALAARGPSAVTLVDLEVPGWRAGRFLRALCEAHPELLDDWLASPNTRFREAASETVMNRAEVSTELLVRVLDAEGGSWLGRRAAEMLLRAGHPAGMPVLLSQLSDASQHITERVSAARVVALAETAEAVDAIAASLSQCVDDDHVRDLANVLGSMRSPAALKALEREHDRRRRQDSQEHLLGAIRAHRSRTPST